MKAVGLSMAAALVAAVSLCSCSKAEEQFSDEPCYFVFDNSVHQNSTLATAMASMSPGVFCLVRETPTPSTCSARGGWAGRMGS